MRFDMIIIISSSHFQKYIHTQLKTNNDGSYKDKAANKTLILSKGKA